jgi:hypothetical protein
MRDYDRPGEFPRGNEGSPKCIEAPKGLDEGMFRQRPTLPPRLQGSTIGAGGLNFRVRNGTGCFPSAIATETLRGCKLRGAPGTSQRARADQVLGLLVPVG